MKGNARATDALVAMLADAYVAYRDRFDAIARRAPGRFERAEWALGRHDAAERLALVRTATDVPVAAAREWLVSRGAGRELWPDVKREFRERMAARDDAELAETFFNSATRRILGTVGVEAAAEFTDRTPLALRSRDESRVLDVVAADDPYDPAALIAAIIARREWSCGWADAPLDARLAGEAIARAIRFGPASASLVRAEVLRPVFYRNKGAYLVGRLVASTGAHPLVLALVRRPEGVAIDAVLLTSDEASVVFGFSRSYFHAEIACPAAVISVLASIMPLKRVDEIYTAIGFNKHGKRELYRLLVRHLERAEARFEVAEGDEGLVMAVFTLPSFNVVFKVIKDRFGEPKRTTREEVRAKYEFVFVRDRVGRLADAQEFQQLELPADRFEPSLLAHLLATCGNTIRVEGGRVRAAHLYTERRVTPLNLYLRQVGVDEARRAVLDYGRAIKELASSNIFTGDMLLKNFGVSRHGRVICYDYDELGLLTDCVVRRIPPPADIYDELSAEPYFSVGEHDIFPEEFGAFMVPAGPLRDAFLAEHADLLTVELWREMQERARAGDGGEFFPYDASRRLHARDGRHVSD